MATYIALLRGINVGGRTRVRMEELRDLLSSLDYHNVRTHLQSGNVLFESYVIDERGLAAEISDQIARDLGLHVAVMVRTPEELSAAIAANPFPEAASSPTQLHVAFLSKTPAAARTSVLDPDAFAPDRMCVIGQEAYLWYPNGAGRSKLTTNVIERQLAVDATARNWNTVTRLLELAG